MEARVLRNYPELEQRVVINKEAEEKLSNRGFERKRRTGKVPERDQLTAKLQDIFQNCQTRQAFFAALNEAGLEFYARGKTLGVKDIATERKHRLKTLGLMDAFDELSARIELDEGQNTKNDAQEKADTKAKQSRTGKTSAGEKRKTEKKTRAEKPSTAKPEEPHQQDTQEKTAVEQEQAKRKAEMENIRRQHESDGDEESKGEKKQ